MSNPAKAFALALFTPALFAPALLLAAGPQDGSGGGNRDGSGERHGLLGRYEITGGENDGKPVPKERIKDTSVTITEDTFAVVDPDEKELYSAKYKLTKAEQDGDRKEAEKGVWRIDMESKVPKSGDKAVGLLKRDGDQVWLIYALGETRPEGFDQTEPGQHLFKLKRLEKGETPGDAPKEGKTGGT